MAGKDWNNLGSDLNRIIEDAVHMGNFGRLNENINDTIRRAFRTFDGGEFRSGDGWDFDLSGKAQDNRPGKTQNEQRNQYDQRRRPEAGATGQTSGPHTRGAYAGMKPAYGSPRMGNAFFAGSGKRKSGSIIMLIIGIILAAVSVIPLGIFLIGGLLLSDSFGYAAAVVCAVLVAAGVIFIVKGGAGLKLSGRFEQYIRVLDGKEYGDIKMLAAYCHRPEDEILKDIRKMMHRPWFLQGHLDQGEKCLMVSDDAYEQYLETIRTAKLREEENRKKQQEEAKRNGGLTPEVRAILQKGNEYIESIRRSNDAIPGEEISEKIYRMEQLVRKIFQQTEAHPENARDLRKLMEYYLPMTVKLLKAYEELDAQPVQGENIVNSKKEIENTLDTLNIAFEKLLDNLFRDTAWDVSSDISVLQTMLAQEGLTEDGFSKQ